MHGSLASSEPSRQRQTWIASLTLKSRSVGRTNLFIHWLLCAVHTRASQHTHLMHRGEIAAGRTASKTFHAAV
jgi:hypothetical protein